MRRVQSAPNIVEIKHHLRSTVFPKTRSRAASTTSLPALVQQPVQIFHQEPLQIEVAQSISTERGLASAVCVELYDANELSEESLQALAECLSTPLSNDQGLGEIVQAEVDDVLQACQKLDMQRRRRILAHWLSKNGRKDTCDTCKP